MNIKNKNTKIISVSTGSLPYSIGSNAMDYDIIPKLYDQLKFSGVELQFPLLWYNKKYKSPNTTLYDCKPITDRSLNKIINTFKNNNIKVNSVHIYKHIMDMLISNDNKIYEKGKTILKQNLYAMEILKSKIAVIHLWNGYWKEFDIKELWEKLYEITYKYPQIKIAVENIPNKNKNYTIIDIWEYLSQIMPNNYGFTLDLQWGLKDNFTELIEFRDKIINVHIQGVIQYNVDNDPFITTEFDNNSNILDLLKIFSYNKGYNELFTLELRKPRDFKEFRIAYELINKNTP